IEVAGNLEPSSPSYFCVRGRLCLQAGRVDEARESFRQAIQLSVDTDYAIGALMASCDTNAERREALAFVEQELIRQVIFGDALKHALQINPAWGSAARRLAEVYERDGGYAEARPLLEQAIARTPLDSLNHGCLADVLWHLEEKEAALERVQQALRLDPGYEW